MVKGNEPQSRVDGNVEARIIAIACSDAPEERDHWTLQMIADELVRLGVVDSISDTAVMNTLKKTSLSPKACLKNRFKII